MLTYFRAIDTPRGLLAQFSCSAAEGTVWH
jgi:hypothetical protein